jgi:hypothetical protein
MRSSAVRILLILVISSAILAPPAYGRTDPETNKIRMLMIGETKAQHQSATAHMFADPKVDLTLIPAGDIANVDTSKRFVRIYIPRTKEDLITEFDVFELFDFVPHVLQLKHIDWITEGVREEGVGLGLTEMGWYDVTDWTGNDAEAWMSTSVYEAYPVDLVIGVQNKDATYMDIVERGEGADRNLLVELPGFEQVALTEVGHHGLERARPGSTVHTVWSAGGEDAIVSGSYGDATTLMIPMGWDNIPAATERNWYHYVDFVLNHVYFLAQVKIPEDLQLIHQLRASFYEYFDQMAMTSGLLEFIDKFGANTRPVEEMLLESEAMKEDAELLYLRDDYSGAWESMSAVMERFDRISQESVKIKDRALMWVYMTEWLAVMGTLAICGSIIWALMVKRRLYKEVSVTRSAL